MQKNVYNYLYLPLCNTGWNNGTLRNSLSLYETFYIRTIILISDTAFKSNCRSLRINDNDLLKKKWKMKILIKI